MKASLFSLLKKSARYAGLSRDEYLLIKPDIYQNNYSNVLLMSALGTLLLGSFALLSTVLPLLYQHQDLYICFFCVFAVICLAAKIFLPKHIRFATLFAYIVLMAGFAFGILIGTVFQRDMPATTFCVMLFALPLLLIDQPYRCNLMMGLATACFCICSAVCKDAVIWEQDLINAISFLILGIAVNYYVMRTKLRDLLNRSYIERERDTDALTTLSTRRAAEREIRKYMQQTRDAAVLLILDIDDFKHINDTFGHDRGDEIMALIGRCIRTCFRQSDILARLGGDELMVFLPHLSRPAVIDQHISRLREELKEQVLLGGYGFPVTISIGAAFYPRDFFTFEELYHAADLALYASKKHGKNRLTHFSQIPVKERQP